MKQNDKCGMCNGNHKPIAVTVNEIKICRDCRDFEINRAKSEGNNVFVQMEIDTKYMIENPV